MKRSWLSLNIATGLRPIRRRHWLARYARAAVDEAQSVEAIHARSFGGHRHGGSGNPLLTELPLPSGWRKP
jgi:hypothetical protein